MKKIEVPKTSERIRGISLPENGVIYLCDYDEVYKITIGSNSEPEILDDDPYEFLYSLPAAIGITDKKPIHESNGNSISYDFDPTKDSISVQFKIESVVSSIDFPILSGDWFEVSFSKCGKYVILAEPYGFELYEVA
jgi:hypothetical protein